MKCYRHSGNEYNLRAHLEDLIEIEKRRAGKNWAKADAKMKFADGSRILNAAIRVMRVLGWSWRWAEWWVDYESSWEPLLEPHEKEEDMTKEQLKIVDSTRESRATDARRCRLATFGAALRNRAYDIDDKFDVDALDRSLRAILHTASLVGPMEKYEIDFLADWLGRAYKSKSRILGFGEDKIEVAREAFCLHMEDQSPKFELGNRSVPGKQKPVAGEKFETGIVEVDDFLKTEISEDAFVPPPQPIVTSNVKRGPGRPPKAGRRNTEAEREKRRERDRRRREREREAREELQRKCSRSSDGESHDNSKIPQKKNKKQSRKSSFDEKPKMFAVYRLPDGKFARRYDSDNLVESEIPRPGEAKSLNADSATIKSRNRKAGREKKHEDEPPREEQEQEPNSAAQDDSESAGATVRGRHHIRRYDTADESDSDVRELTRRGPGRPRKQNKPGPGSVHRGRVPRANSEDDSDTAYGVRRHRSRRSRIREQSDAVPTAEAKIVPGGSRNTPTRAARARQSLSEEYLSEFESESSSEDDADFSRSRSKSRSRRNDESSEAVSMSGEKEAYLRKRKQKLGLQEHILNDTVADERPKTKRGRPFKNPQHSHEPPDETDLLNWKIPKKDNDKKLNEPDTDCEDAAALALDQKKKSEDLRLSNRNKKENFETAKYPDKHRASRLSSRLKDADGEDKESDDVKVDSNEDAESSQGGNSRQKRRRLHKNDDETSIDKIDEDSIPLYQLVAIEKAKASKEDSATEVPTEDDMPKTDATTVQSDGQNRADSKSTCVVQNTDKIKETEESIVEEKVLSVNAGQEIETHRRLARIEGKDEAIRLFK